MASVALNRPAGVVLSVTAREAAAVMASSAAGYRATVRDRRTGSDWRLYGLPCDCGRACRLLGRRVPRRGLVRREWGCPDCGRSGSIGLASGDRVLCSLCGSMRLVATQ